MRILQQTRSTNRDLTMNTHTTQRIKSAKWQNIVILIILISLLISALPNLYSDETTLHLSNEAEQSEQLSPQTINNLLSETPYRAKNITTTADQTSITLENEANLPAVEKLMNNNYGEKYRIDTSTHNSAPAWLAALGGKPIKLGLDLSGGVLFVLDVDIERALSDRLKSIAVDIKSLAVEDRVRISRVTQTDDDAIIVHYAPTQKAKVAEFLAKVAKNYPELSEDGVEDNQSVLVYSPQEQVKFRQETMQQTLKTMRGRIEELGITEAVTQKQGKNRIRIELPGVHDPEKAKKIIGATASLDFYQMAENSRAIGVMKMKDSNGRTLNMNSKVVFSGSNIKNARAGQDEMGIPLVNLTLDSLGGKKMSEFSKENVGKPMVTVFSEFYRNTDDEMIKKSKVINVATIQQQLGSQFSITNMSSREAANELALLLRAGSLTAPVTIVKQRSIEATLGADNIEKGATALAIGITFTLLFMAFWYRSLGVIANTALALNLVSLLGLMSLLPGAVLTLPGIAGLVLTVGMAVDTNVLIFEKIKEELKRGRQTLSAIENGYKSAFSTILDANITTMITGIILYSVGYGPVKGFAIILCLGILTSMFTGVFVSKAITNLAIRQNKPQLLGVKS